jgi:hypothetical protein
MAQLIFSSSQLTVLARQCAFCEIEQTFLNRKFKAITAYFGEFAL